jgi:Zn-dependent M28 family amino/carboxypeptidase
MARAGTLCLFETPTMDLASRGWAADFDFYFTAVDWAVGIGSGQAASALPFATILAEDVRPEDCLVVHVRSDQGVRAAERAGEVLLERDGVVILLPSTSASDLALMPGVHFVQPMRPVALSAQVPVVNPGGYDDYVADMVSALSQTQYQATIQQLQNYLTRYSSTDSYDTAAIWVRDQFSSFGLDAELQYFSMGSYNCENAIGELPGIIEPDKIVIICGHLDSTSPQPYSNAPGADDNASGSAAVVEAARIMSDYAFRYTVRFICFGGEEQGLYGSAYYASQAASAGDDILGVVNLDMVLYGPPGQDIMWVPYNSASSGLALALDAICDTYVPALDVTTEYDPSITYSDHSSFWNNGYQAVLAIEQEVFSNPYYHQTSDILSNYTIYFPFGTNCTKGALATVATLAQPQGMTGVEEGGSGSVPGSLAILSIGPNPSSGELMLGIEAPEGPLGISIFDLAGRTVYAAGFEHRGGGTVLSVDVSGLPSGVFLLKAASSGGESAARFTVVR